jgi:hypothetical protein
LVRRRVIHDWLLDEQPSFIPLEQATQMKKLDIIQTLEWVEQEFSTDTTPVIPAALFKRIDVLRKMGFLSIVDKFDKEQSHWYRSLGVVGKGITYLKKHRSKRPKLKWVLMFLILLIQYIAFVLAL